MMPKRKGGGKRCLVLLAERFPSGLPWVPKFWPYSSADAMHRIEQAMRLPWLI